MVAIFTFFPRGRGRYRFARSTLVGKDSVAKMTRQHGGEIEIV
jgi:hypothetical protein